MNKFMQKNTEEKIWSNCVMRNLFRVFYSLKNKLQPMTCSILITATNKSLKHDRDFVFTILHIACLNVERMEYEINLNSIPKESYN